MRLASHDTMPYSLRDKVVIGQLIIDNTVVRCHYSLLVVVRQLITGNTVVRCHYSLLVVVGQLITSNTVVRCHYHYSRSNYTINYR